VAGSKISFSYSGIGAMLRSAFMEDHMRDRAELMFIAAWDRAPVYTGPDKDDHRGRYRASLRVETSRAGGDRHDRAEGRVVAESDEAIWVEKGARAYGKIPARPAQHVLGQALMEAAGDD